MSFVHLAFQSTCDPWCNKRKLSRVSTSASGPSDQEAHIKATIASPPWHRRQRKHRSRARRVLSQHTAGTQLSVEEQTAVHLLSGHHGSSESLKVIKDQQMSWPCRQCVAMSGRYGTKEELYQGYAEMTRGSKISKG